MVWHIGRVNNTSVFLYRDQWFKIVQFVVIEHDTLFTLLQMTQLTNEYQTGTHL